MDGYDQLWSLVEADGSDGVPGLIRDAAPAAVADPAPVADLQVDVSALEGFADDSWLTAGTSGADDFFPIHAPAAFAGSALPAFVPSTGETPLVLPATPDVIDMPEPLVLPGVMSDDFFIDKHAGDALVQPAEPDTFEIPDTGEHFLGRYALGGVADLPVDHTLYVDDHGLIGAHGADDWLL